MIRNLKLRSSFQNKCHCWFISTPLFWVIHFCDVQKFVEIKWFFFKIYHRLKKLIFICFRPPLPSGYSQIVFFIIITESTPANLVPFRTQPISCNRQHVVNGINPPTPFLFHFVRTNLSPLSISLFNMIDRHPFLRVRRKLKRTHIKDNGLRTCLCLHGPAKSNQPRTFENFTLLKCIHLYVCGPAVRNPIWNSNTWMTTERLINLSLHHIDVASSRVSICRNRSKRGAAAAVYFCFLFLL